MTYNRLRAHFESFPRKVDPDYAAGAAAGAKARATYEARQDEDPPVCPRDDAAFIAGWHSGRAAGFRARRTRNYT